MDRGAPPTAQDKIAERWGKENELPNRRTIGI